MMRRLWAVLVALVALALPAVALAAAPPGVKSEQTVLSFRQGEMRFFDQLTLSSTGSLTWPVAHGATGVTVGGGRLVARHGDEIAIDATATDVSITYAVQGVGETFVWTRDVGKPPATWVVLVAPGIRVGWVQGLPFAPEGHVKIAGLTLSEYAYAGQGHAAFAWPFLTSGVPQDLSTALLALIGVALLAGAYLAWRGFDAPHRSRRRRDGSATA